VPARADDRQQPRVLPDQRPLGVGQVQHEQLPAEGRVGDQHVEQGVLEPHVERVDDLDPVAPPPPDGDADLARQGRADEVAVAEPQAPLVAADPNRGEHGPPPFRETRRPRGGGPCRGAG
jgi:hypothetical protein